MSRPHLPMRPLWRCRGCGALWPCQPARLALLAEYRDDRVGLLVYLGTMMAEAGDQLARLNGAPPTCTSASLVGRGPGRHNVSRES